VTVDNGISAVEPIALAGELGMDVVVTDHHEPHGTLPAALAVVDPHREGDRYPFPDLAGVGVAFKLACAVDALLDPDRDRWRELCLRYLDLVAFGTIADVMTLTGENRLIVAMGLPLIERGERIGLRALMEQAGVARHLSASAVSFTLAPRINAAGRLGSALRAVELLLEESPVIADDIAVELCRRNKERQAEEAGIAQSAAERIRLLGLEEDPFFVLDHDDWHPGITGIAASRLTERTSRPSLLITYDGEVGKGSARSVEGVNLMALLAECDDLLIQYGGHEMAAGLTVEREKVPALRARLCALMREQYPCGLPEPVCLADCEITLSEVSVEQIGQLRALEPCGAGNPQPLFLLRSLHIADMTAVGGGKHTRLQLRQGRDSITAMYFGVCPEQMDYLVGDEVDLLAQMELNEWNGRVSAQLLIRDMDHAADYAAEQLHRRRLIEDYLSGSDTALSSPFLPARADFAHLYRYLRRACAGGDLEMGLRALCLAGLEGENRTYKGPLILRIFTETGLLRTEQIECPVADSGSCRACRVRIAVPDQAGSVDLMQNPLYRRLVSEV